ncbi:hypothetical protein, partial [Nocardia gipuzkoensis]
MQLFFSYQEIDILIVWTREWRTIESERAPQSDSVGCGARSGVLAQGVSVECAAADGFVGEAVEQVGDRVVGA